MTARPPLASAPAGYAFSYVDRVRFGDLDAMRHLNNVEFLRFFEDARIAYLRGLAPEHDPVHPEADFGLIFAEAHIRYHSPAFHPEEIRTWIRPSHLRRSSFRARFRMEAGPDRRLVAEGWGALVGYDYPAGRAAPLPDTLVAALREAGATEEGPE